MGTDIHGTFQKKATTEVVTVDNVLRTTWIDIEHSVPLNRHYFLFGILADVRNGSGFAGVDTGDPVKPIATPRGLPQDQVTFDDCIVFPAPLLLDGELAYNIWMGDHSYSWFYGSELLAWYDENKDRRVARRGVISKDEYLTWRTGDRTSPDSYSGWISGSGIRVVSEDEIAHLFRLDAPADPNSTLPMALRDDVDYTHVKVEWLQQIQGEVAYFFDAVKELMDQHGEVRFVFGFDS